MRISDSITERESDKSIQKNTNDIFCEIYEKLSAVFNITGFAIYIKITGMILIKNYVHNRLNLRVLLNDEFVTSTNEETSFANTYSGVNLGYSGTSNK